MIQDNIKFLDIYIKNDIKVVNLYIKTELDGLDQALVSFFQQYPNRSYRVHEIVSIFRYAGIDVSYRQILGKLHDLCVLAYISKEMLGKTYIYFYKP